VGDIANIQPIIPLAWVLSEMLAVPQVSLIHTTFSVMEPFESSRYLYKQSNSEANEGTKLKNLFFYSVS